MHIISNVALISINETMIVILVSFLLFMFAINRIMFRPLQSAMNDRDAHIDDLRKALQEGDTQIYEMLADLKQKEAAVVAEANDVRKSLEEEGEQTATEVSARASREIAEMKRSAQAEVDLQLADVRKSLESEAWTLAVGVMEKVLDRRLDP